MKKLFALAGCFFALLATPAVAQGDRSLTDSEWPDLSLGSGSPANSGPVPTAPPGGEASALPFPSFPTMGRSLRGSTDSVLQESILLLRATIAELTQSLALANAEAETFKRQATELATKLDALGLVEMEANPDALEQKLLTAVREVRLQQQRNFELENALVILVEAVVTLLQEAQGVGPQTRLDIETTLRSTNELLGSLPGVEEAPAIEATLTNALVLETRPEISLLIANIGTRQGARIGTPLVILRGDQLIGSALIVDVRERISGAIIQNLNNEENPVQPGDRLRVATSN
jgi:hypothetical protein